MRGIVSSLAVLAAAGVAVADSQITCAKGLYIIVARGSLEPQGTGVTGNLTDEVIKRVPDSQVAPLVYPASFDVYEPSEMTGVENLHGMLTNYTTACPDGKIALFGYSQGAQVTMDTLCGGAGGAFTTEAGVPASIVDKITSVTIYGDPTFVANLTYDRGTSKKNGIFQRNNSANCLPYANKILSFCDTGDVYCNSGSNQTVHHQYITKYGDQIVDYVVSKFQAASGSSSSGGNGTASAPTPSSSSSGGKASATVPASSGKPTTVHNAAAAGTPPHLLAGAALIAALTAAMSQML